MHKCWECHLELFAIQLNCKKTTSIDNFQNKKLKIYPPIHTFISLLQVHTQHSTAESDLKVDDIKNTEKEYHNGNFKKRGIITKKAKMRPSDIMITTF